jgi:hypothetical protein
MSNIVKMNKGNKHNNMKQQDRLDSILRLIEQGKYTYQMVDILAPEWGVHPRTVYRYLELFKQTIQKEVRLDKDRVVTQYEMKANKYEGMGEHKVAQEYLKMRDKIAGYNAPDKVNLSIDIFKAGFGENKENK